MWSPKRPNEGMKVWNMPLTVTADTGSAFNRILRLMRRSSSGYLAKLTKLSHDPNLTVPSHPATDFTRLPMNTIQTRLQQLGITLPTAPKPVAAYVPAVRTGNLIFVSGQIPMAEGNLIAIGPVPSAVSIEQAQAAARQCVLNGLAVVQQLMDVNLDDIRRIVRLGVFVCSDAGFTEQPKVANGASELLAEIFGDLGRHTRAAVGSIALPLGASVEVEMLVEVA